MEDRQSVSKVLKKNYSLLGHNTFGFDVKASCFFDYQTVEELRDFIYQGGLTKPYLHIGGGSNLLFTQDYEGLVLHSQIKTVEVLEETSEWVCVRVGAGTIWDDFVAYAVERSWYGIENLSWIPGEVGAAAVQNIGAYGVEVKDVIVEVETLTGEGMEKRYAVSECGYAYRKSVFKTEAYRSEFVTHVTFKLCKESCYRLEYGAIRKELANYPEITLSLVREVIISIRKEKLPDPKEWGNGGSFFMNPIVSHEVFQHLKEGFPEMPFYELEDGTVKIPAGWLIEACGWKGKRLGPAGVFEKQALVLVNLGGATGADVVALSNAVRASVYEMFKIDICPEVNFI